MRLQRLEISGFKSFPDRSELAFDQGVTAIVGPNGCGKSNVVDAITWVLGEQSAKSLRGERMEDIIFSGSDARRPTGAAEVRLRLAGVLSRTNGNDLETGKDPAAENLESESLVEVEQAIASEVEVARRLYRSGESEYLIDGNVCRLRDVQDLLMDAGLGVKAYAVIEQGKIGQILGAKPTERRQLIEEAAGVTKYKSRRHAAELKLEAAQQNLTRVDDIVFELEKQRAALKRQAAKTRRFKRLRDELRRWEKVVFTNRYRMLAQTIESTQARLADARGSAADAARRVAALEETLQRVRQELEAADARATSHRQETHVKELEVERRQQQIAFNRQQIDALRDTCGALAEELRTLEERREPTRAELCERREAAARADQERDETSREVEAAEEAYTIAHRDIEGLEGQVDVARSEVFAAISAATALRHALEHAAVAQNRLTEALSKLEMERADLRIEMHRATTDRESAEQALHETREMLDRLRGERTQLDGERSQAWTDREDRTRQMRAGEREVAGLSGRLRSLEELDAARAGYGDAARLILSQSAIPQLGSVADYLDVDRDHERAVEACLGDLLQYVLVATHGDAAAGLELARGQNAGRCGFLVVESADADTAESALTSDLIPLANLVTVSGPYAAAIRTALASTWMAPSYDAALNASRRVAGSVVTLEGDVFRAPSLVAGGGRDEARGILATKREIKELRDRLAIEHETLRVSGEELAALDTRIVELDVRIASIDTQRHQQEKTIVGFDMRIARSVEEVERLTRKQELNGTERRHAEEERQTLQTREVEARESIARIELDQGAADRRLADVQRKLFQARERAEGLGRIAAEAKARGAALRERSTGLEAEVRRLEDASRDLENRISVRADEIQRNEGNRSALETAIADAEERFTADTAQLDALRRALQEAEEWVAQCHSRFQSDDAAIRQARHELDALRALVGQCEVAQATAESDLSHLAASCVETVQSSLQDVVAEVTELEATQIEPPVAPEGMEEESEGDEEIQSDVERSSGAMTTPATAEDVVLELRAKIDRLGPVNMMAIDQFDELESRHAFLSVQRKDLVDAIAATGEAIKRIDRTTRERFQDAFEAINTQFGESFTTLFGGGRAGLVLLDESDLLESGIDIIAQPPGKRLQNVQLLSGGEKALTAMALMFAIFRYRPSPFCLLDEIDAPLDDANIGRFIEMLRGMQVNTQFILITHNRKTMEIADRLYGVTMEEPGVSKLISLQLN